MGRSVEEIEGKERRLKVYADQWVKEPSWTVLLWRNKMLYVPLPKPTNDLIVAKIKIN